jgi:hypothetical protein
MKLPHYLVREPARVVVGSRTIARAAILGILLVFFFGPAAVQAQFYFITNNGTITITGYYGSGGEVTVPSTINGWPVTGIGQSAFYKTAVTSLVLSDGIADIGANAFSDCFGLTNLTLGNTVTNVGLGAFYQCQNLVAVTIPDSVITIGGSAFYGNNSLASLALGTNLASIGSSAFQSCTTLGSVTIPDSVTNIGGGGFYGCFSLSNLVLGSGLSTIAGDAFGYNRSLGSVLIPNSVVMLDTNAFFACSALTNVALGNSLTSIGAYAFESCRGLTSITFPNSLKTIGFQAFAASGLTSLTIPDSVTSVGGSAFMNCVHLTSAIIGNAVTTLDSAQFYNCSDLTSVYLGTGLTNIGGDGGFYGGYTFAYCTNLTGIYFQGNAPSIVSSVFYLGNLPTLYYLLGRNGWGGTIDSCPTALWKPLVLTADPSFGVRTNQFGFIITWAKGQAIVVEACTHVSNPDWSPLQTNTLDSSSLYFTDPLWMNYPGRFYRVRSQ